MKKLLLVIITGLSLFIGASFADFTTYTVTPADQVAISGSLVSWNIHIVNSTGDAYVKVMLPWTQTEGIAYRNASQLPLNNSLMQLGVGNEPIFYVASGATLNLVVTGKVVTSSRGFTQMGIKFPASNDSGFAGMFTSAIATVTPIADLAISKILTGALPMFSGDLVHYIVTIQNIGSTFATGIQLRDWFPIPLIGLPSALVNGNPLAYNTPITLPNIFVRDLGGAYILNPGQSTTFQISAPLMQQVAAGTTFVNTAKAVTASSEYTTGNNSATVTGMTVTPVDLYITKTMQTFTGYQAGSIVTYTITYGNSGGTAAQNVTIQDLVPASLYIPTSTWNIGTLPAGSGGTIIFTGSLLTALQAGDTIVNKATITGNGVEVATGNNSATVTGTIAALPNITLDITANNLTRPQYDTTQYGASGPNIMILAVSGDIVQLTIHYGNNGNTAANSGIISLAGLGGFVSYGAFNGTLGNLNIGQTGTIVITGIVGPQNYSGFTPLATLTYNSTQTVSDSVKVQEPFVCGDGLITRTEPCDTAGMIGLTISGQVCENHGGFCVAVTKDIINTACMDYRFTLGSGHICSSVQFPIEEVGQCKELIVHGSSIILADEDDGDYLGDAHFTCNAQNGIASTIAIDCGNGEIHTGTNVSTLDATCHYNESSIPRNRTVQCYVDGTTQSGCQQNMIIDQAEFGRCGDGIIQGYEQCDEEGMEEDETINGCRNCHLVDEEVPPMACFSLGNTNISIQENEILPFRWKVDFMGSKLTDECGDGDDGKIVRDSMKCEFRIFNGDKKESGEGSNLGDYDAPTVKTFTKDCDIDERVNDNGQLNNLFKYFDNQKEDNYTLLKHSGRYALDFSDVDIDGVYGEYNIALYKVKYNYCENGEEKAGTPLDRVCETDFTVTKPYLAQKSSFGLTPKATTVNLDGYEDILGNPIVKKTDLDQIMVLDANTYKGGTNVNSLMTTFINKYSKLAISLDKNKIRAFKDTDVSVKVVPQQKIYILEAKAGETTNLTLNPSLVSDTPFTIVTRNINLIVEGDLTTNGMFLIDNGTISFQETDAERCDHTQTVQGIFITNKGFAADTEGLSNDSVNKTRCNFGGLTIKGVLIGNNIQDLVDSRRAQLNHWFIGSDSLSERRNEIFRGASVLIEYSPSLRAALPPGAGEFTKALDVYKK